MSYTKVKSVKVFQGDDRKWYITANCAESNVRPVTYRKFTFPKSGFGYDTREAAESYLVSNYANGSLQGHGVYSDFVRSLELGLFKSKAWDRANRCRSLADKAYSLARKLYDGTHLADGHYTADQFNWTIYRRLNSKADSIIENDMGADFIAFCDASKASGNRRFVLYFDRPGGRHYVTKFTSSRYYVSIIPGDASRAVKLNEIKAADLCSQCAEMKMEEIAA